MVEKQEVEDGGRRVHLLPDRLLRFNFSLRLLRILLRVYVKLNIGYVLATNAVSGLERSNTLSRAANGSG